MANPSDDIRKSREELAKFEKELGGFSTKSQKHLAVFQSAFFENIGTLKKGFKKEIAGITASIESGLTTAPIESFSKKFQDAIIKSGLVTKSFSGKSVVDLKTIGQAMMSGAASGSILSSAVRKLGMASENAGQNENAAFTARHRAKRLVIEEVIAATMGQADASKNAFNVMLAGTSGEITYQKELLSQIEAGAGTEEEKDRARIKSKEKIAEVVRKAGRTTAQATAAEAAAAKLGTGASRVMESQGWLASKVKGLAIVQRVANAEQKAIEDTKAGTGEVRSALTGTDKAASQMISAVLGISSAIAPMALMTGTVMRLIESFDRAKTSGAGLLQVQAANRGIAGAGWKDAMKSGAVDDIAKIRKELGFMSAVSVDPLYKQSLALANGMGGLADKERSVVEGLTRIQVMAPLAGQSAEQSLQLVGRGHKAFGFKNQGDVVNYFNKIRMGAKVAGMSIEDFATAGNIDNIGLTWGAKVGPMVDTLTKMSAGHLAGAGPGARGLLVGAMAQTANQDVSKSVGLRMFGGQRTMDQAVGKMMADAADPIKGGMETFREVMTKSKLGGPNMSNTDLFKASQVAQGVFGFNQQQSMSMLLKPGFLDAMMGRKPQDDEFRKAMSKADLEKDPMALAASIASNQLGALEQIRNMFEELLQDIARYGILGLKDGMANKQNLGPGTVDKLNNPMAATPNGL